MQKTYTKIKTTPTDHTTFGGVIYASDFNTDHRGKNYAYGSLIANRIAQDQKFDAECIKNGESRNAHG